MSRIAIASGVVVEELGADLMVMIPGSTEVLALSGDAATAVRRIQSGSPVATDAVVSDLVRLGVLETAGLSRRGLIRAGAIGAGAGIAVLAMPSVAAASSELVFELNGFFFAGQNDTWVFVLAEYADLEDNWPSPQPSDEIGDVSGLTILGATLPIVYNGLDDNSKSIEWNGSVSEDPVSGVTGVFTWEDGARSYRYEVTFSS